LEGSIMAPGYHIVLSGVLTFGVPLAFALHELRTLRRPQRGPDDRGRDPDPARPPPPPGDAPALKPLPSCLIPNLPPARMAGRSRALDPV
jgi:hypothetical protein